MCVCVCVWLLELENANGGTIETAVARKGGRGVEDDNLWFRSLRKLE